MAETKMTSAEEYRARVREMLTAASRWLERNADQLSQTFSDGCEGWSITFSHEGCDSFPCIEVRADKVDRGMLNALMMNVDAD